MVIRKMTINGQEYDVGVDIAAGDSVTVEEHYMRPSAEYPDGSWMHKVGDRVEVATGYFAIEHPGKPSPYFHDGPPFIFVDTSDWAWESTPKTETEKENGIS
jgi:hypothetical protein